MVYCAGWSLLLLAAFYLVIDVRRIRAWTLFFVVIGSNSILIYMAHAFVDFDFTTHFFFDGLLKNAGVYRPLLWSIAFLAIQWTMLYWLFRKRIFLRV